MSKDIVTDIDCKEAILIQGASLVWIGGPVRAYKVTSPEVSIDYDDLWISIIDDAVVKRFYVIEVCDKDVYLRHDLAHTGYTKKQL